MAGKEKVMAVLMGPVEVRQTFRDWPAEMCLAVCLMENGDCQLVVFRQEEADLFPSRLQTHLRLRAEELCFFPPAPGYPTRSLLYSDERRLMALVAEAPEIVEEASDYSVNYAYALEEGLDPAVFLGVEAGNARPVPRDSEPAMHEAGGARPAADFVSRRGKPAAPAAPASAPRPSERVRKALLPGFMQRTEPVPPGPRFQPARDLTLAEGEPALCDIQPEESGWILVTRGQAGGSDIRISDPDLLYLRDDRSVIAIRLEPPWDMTAPLPGRVWIKAKSLSPSLRAVFDDCAGTAAMTGSGAFLYLHVRPRPVAAGAAGMRAPGAAPAAETAPSPETAAPAHRPRKTRRRLLALTGVAAAAVLVHLGLQLVQQDGLGPLGAEAPIDWDRFRSAWQAARAG